MDATLPAILTLLAILLSPLVAVLVTVYLQGRKEKRDQKLSLLATLIGTRHAPTSEDAIRALNLVDIVFHDAPHVRQLWQDYFGMLNNEGLNNPTGWAQRQKKNLEMITEMARVLGYGKAITHLDMDRVYYPVALAERAAKEQVVANGFLKLLDIAKASAAKPVESSGQTETSEPSKQGPAGS